MGRVLVVNSGSSSVRYRVYTVADGATGDAGDVLAPETGGLVEQIGEAEGPVPDHTTALRDVLESLELSDLTAVGHRVVHGGLQFHEPTVVDDRVVAAVEELVPMAPLHNPANLAGITACRWLLPAVPQVAVFDTAFHRTLPAAAATYAVDSEVAQRYGVHRYGFHGTSHAFVARRTAEILGRPPGEVNTVTLHLGNGASACAVAGGRSVATSMGLTPLEGLVMGTRSGDVDPALPAHLHRVAGMSVEEVDTLLNRHSGLRGLAGSNDMREVLAARDAGDEAAALAFDVYCHRVRCYVGAYYAALGRVDAVTFTAGVGEHAAAVRAASLDGLERLGIHVDPERNARHEPVVSPPDSEVAVCVVPTDEEREIATQALATVAAG